MTSRPKPAASPAVKHRGWWIVLPAVAAFCVALYWQLPAALLLRLLPTPLPAPWATTAEGLVVDGTLWSGTARGLVFAGQPIGRVRWQISPLQGLLAKAEGSLEVVADQGSLVTALAVNANGDGALTDLRVQWPLASLQSSQTPPWRGTLTATLDEIVLREGRVASWTGVLRLQALSAPGGGPALGDFEAVWPAGSNQGRVRDLAGPVELRAALLRGSDGRYRLEGEAAPRPSAGAPVREALLLFGPPDRAGRHALRLEFGLSTPP